MLLRLFVNLRLILLVVDVTCTMVLRSNNFSIGAKLSTFSLKCFALIILKQAVSELELLLITSQCLQTLITVIRLYATENFLFSQQNSFYSISGNFNLIKKFKFSEIRF